MTGTNSENLTRRIQQAFNITDVVTEHVRLSRAGKDFKGLCPFHQEKTPSFYVSPAKQIFKCFGCGAGGDVIKFVQLRERVGFVEARSMLAARAGISLETTRSRGANAEIDKAALARANDWALRWFRKRFMDSVAGATAREYAEKRGLTPESIETFAIGYAPASWDALLNDATSAGIPNKLLIAAGLVRLRKEGGCYDYFRDRLMFPIRDVMQRVVGFGGRALGDDPAKYLNSPQTLLFDKASCLYGLDIAKSAIGEAGRAVVVEGYLDCVMAHQFGFRQTVATLGTSLSESHARMLKRYTDGVVLLFDSDEAGERAADRALPIFLTAGVETRLARVPEGKDPCDYLLAQGAEPFMGLLNSALDALESKWQQMQARYRGASGIPGRRRAVEEFLNVVAAAIDSGAVDPIQRGLVVNQVGKLVGVDAEDLQRQFTGKKARREERSTAAPSSGGGAIAVAMRELLEVLLNEPGYLASIGEHFDPEGLGDDELKRIGRLTVDTIRSAETFELNELLARVESNAESDRITDLAMAGEERGNYAATVEGAVARLQRDHVRRQADGLRETLLDPAEANDASDAAARAGFESARRHQHFASRRKLNAVSIPDGGA